MSFLQSLFGSPEKTGSTYNKGQLGFLDQILQSIKGSQASGGGDITQQQGYQQGQEWLSSLFNDPEFFNKFEAPAMRQFNEEILPGVANRFASQGTGGSLGSTGFRNALGRESSNLAERLSSNRTGMQQQGANQALGYGQAQNQNFMQMLQQALQPTQNTFQGPSSGLLGGIIPGLAGGLGTGYGQMWGQSMAGGGQQQQQQDNYGGNQYPLTNQYDQGFRQTGVPRFQ